jgi:choline dehydrogenase-like flavoprotein
MEGTRMTQVYDYVIIGSGFGGSVSAMRLTEKGYSVLVLEKGKRFEDKDFAKSNWQYWKYLWLPALRGHGIMQISLLKGVMVLHGAGVGGGSLGYANVLEVPTDETFATPRGIKTSNGVRCSGNITKLRRKCSVFRAIPNCGKLTFY